jgi:hypothetical protein
MGTKFHHRWPLVQCIDWLLIQNVDGNKTPSIMTIGSMHRWVIEPKCRWGFGPKSWWGSKNPPPIHWSVDRMAHILGKHEWSMFIETNDWTIRINSWHLVEYLVLFQLMFWISLVPDFHMEFTHFPLHWCVPKAKPPPVIKPLATRWVAPIPFFLYTSEVQLSCPLDQMAENHIDHWSILKSSLKLHNN